MPLYFVVINSNLIAILHKKRKKTLFSFGRVYDWVYKQLCCVTEPLHPILPPLIEEYVQAVSPHLVL